MTSDRLNSVLERNVPECLVGARSAATQIERRNGDRFEEQCPVVLIDLDGSVRGKCRTDNVSDGGLHVTLPASLGIGVGHRLGIRFHSAQGGAVLGRFCLQDRYATVVRTKPIPVGQRDTVGVGLRFDKPLAS